MGLYTTLASLSQTAASNVADGSVDNPSTIDQQTNLLASFIARVRDGDRATTTPTVASASTVVLDGVSSNVDISGTTTITAITLAEGGRKLVRFSGALTLTNGASLVLPGGANITTAAGDYAVFTGRASGVVECSEYQVAAYLPKPALSLGSSGYYKFPGGLIVQWGSATTTTSGITANFPITFPTSCLTVQTCVQANGGVGVWASHNTQTTSAVYLQAWTATGTQVAALVEWVAIGY